MMASGRWIGGMGMVYIHTRMGRGTRVSGSMIIKMGLGCWFGVMGLNITDSFKRGRYMGMGNIFGQMVGNTLGSFKTI